MADAYSLHTILRTVYDSTEEAIKTTGGGGGVGSDITIVDVDFSTSQTDDLGVVVNDGNAAQSNPIKVQWTGQSVSISGSVTVTGTVSVDSLPNVTIEDVDFGGGSQTDNLDINIAASDITLQVKGLGVISAGSQGQNTINQASEQLVAQNTSRVTGVFLINDGPSTAYYKLGSGSATSSDFPIYQYAAHFIPTTDEINIISDTAGATINYIEM